MTREQLIKSMRELAQHVDAAEERMLIAAADMLEADGVPVASIYITPGGDREFDDWKHDLPIGRNELYTAPQPATQERKPLTDEQIKALFLKFKQREDSSQFSSENWFMFGALATESAHGITENKP